MTAMESDSEFFSLEPLGFPGWEHTICLKTERGARTLYLRRTGYELGWNIICGANPLAAVTEIINRYQPHFERAEQRLAAA